MESESILVVIIGGTWHRAAVQEIGGLPSRFLLERRGQRCMGSVLQFIDACIGHVDLQSIRAIVVGVPGYVQPCNGNVVLPPAYGPARSYPLRSYISARYGKPVLVENDVNLQTCGEYCIRNHEFASLSLVVVGTGVGSGHVVDNRLLRGSGGIAGEIGYLLTSFDGAIVSVRELCAGGALEDFGFDRRVNPGVLRRLTVGLTTAVNAIALLLDPEIVIFSGGVMSSYGPEVVEALQEHFGAAHDVLVAPRLKKLRFELSSAGHEAAITGAVGLYRGLLEQPAPLGV
jgi:glucokinase